MIVPKEKCQPAASRAVSAQIPCVRTGAGARDRGCVALQRARAASQIRTVLSSNRTLAGARQERRPPTMTERCVALQRRVQRARVGIPDPYRAVIRTGR